MPAGSWLRPEVRELPLLPTWRGFGGIPGPQWTLGIALILRFFTVVGIVFAPVGGHRVGLERPITGVLSLVVGVALLNRRWRAPNWFLHANITVWLLLMGWFIATATSELSMPLNMFGVIAISIYAGAWFPWHQLLLHETTAVMASLAGLLVFGHVRELLMVWFGSAAVAVLSSFLVNMLTRHTLAIANNDMLTGVLNRNGLAAIIESDDAAAVIGAPVAVVVLDLDGFKAVNDERGHRAGDDVLRQVSSALRTGVRATDIVARTGGDEFLVLLPRTTATEAEGIVQRLVARLPIGASFGAAEWAAGEDFDDAMARADRAMYARKPIRPDL